jgi:hypothetical protein
LQPAPVLDLAGRSLPQALAAVGLVAWDKWAVWPIQPGLPVTDLGRMVALHELLAEADGVAAAEHRVLRWRLEQFIQLGFGLASSAVLAGSQVDLAQTRRLVTAGCPLDLALRILL